jgi:hypothetical protein
MDKIDAPFIESFLLVNQFFQKHSIRYCLIGGLAAGYWGDPRYTQDMDFTVALHDKKWKSLESKLTKEKFSFQRQSSSQLQITKQSQLSFQADLFLAEVEYQEWVIQRAIPITIFDIKIPICSPEDLIILKLIAKRRQDYLDIENVLKKHSKELDQSYLKQWCEFWKVWKVFNEEFKSLI